MNRIVFITLLAVAAPAAAQAPERAPSKSEAAERPATAPAPLNLRLDEATRGAPRVTFGRQDAAGKQQEPASNLPTLGGTARSFDKAPRSSSQSSSSPFPKDADPTR